MVTTVIKGNINYIDACEEALVDSELGRKYFTTPGSARRSLESGFHKEEIYVAVDEDNNCKGFVWVIMEGSFHAFPYIHIIAVKNECRGQGIGKILLKYLEDVICKDDSRFFLVVADFNPDAKRFYESIGYTQLCEIPDLYRKGITERLMMKVKE